MLLKFSLTFASLIWATTLISPAQPLAEEPALHLVPAYPNLVLDDNATASAIVPDGSKRIVVTLQRGQARMLPEDKNGAEAPMFLDLREKMRLETGFEVGLHGLAFHPRFPKERRTYVCYTQSDPKRTVLSEFIVPDGGAFRADAGSERIVLEFPQPLGNHWGGGIVFGPDGFLYLGIGDGGIRDDPYRLGQNLWTLHGKILRIDVDGRDPGLAYRIPADNPFSATQEVRSEIWAYGFRNPWGMSFDRSSRTLWCADVGQDTWEEVNLVRKAANYGWSEYEGPDRFSKRKDAPQEEGPFVGPIHSYRHPEGISITGGFVYRAKRLASLRGSYLFGDWGTGKIWALSWDEKSGTALGSKLLYASSPDSPRFNPTVISADSNGEPLLFSHSPAVIFTLRETRLLADAEEESAEEAAPMEVADPGAEITPEDEPS
ncbi:MAG: PQQ-dependent sugar dehydrogenase [Verrucomicrobiota bacterium]